MRVVVMRGLVERAEELALARGASVARVEAVWAAAVRVVVARVVGPRGANAAVTAAAPGGARACLAVRLAGETMVAAAREEVAAVAARKEAD